MLTLNKKSRGFTIVELLIVIVVIAILATISIVAYRGIQQRADNAKTVSAVSAYVKALNMYKADNGNHPAVAASCLGNEYGASGCDSDSIYQVNRSGFNTVHLAPYLGSNIPMPSAKMGEISAGRQWGGAGYVWNHEAFGGLNNGGVVLYSQGGGACPSIGGTSLSSMEAYFDGSGNVCRYKIE